VRPSSHLGFGSGISACVLHNTHAGRHLASYLLTVFCLERADEAARFAIGA
jgi:hypothetical protein